MGGIRNIEYYFQERQLIKELPLSALKDTRLGIDAGHYIDLLLSSEATKEPNVTALGGVPSALGPRIEEHLRTLEVNKIKPIFVFSGLAVRQREKPLSNSEEVSLKPSKRQQAWEHYEKGRVDQATANFSAGSSTTYKDILRFVHRNFKHRNTEFMTAPYLASAQLVYLERHPKSYVHGCFASNELLLFEGAERVILSIDWSKATFTFVNKADILRDLGLTSDQFLDLGLLAGFDHCPTFPIILPHDFSVRAAHNIIQQFRSGLPAVVQYSETHPLVKAASYIELFTRARALIKFSLVLCAGDDSGKVLPLPLAFATNPPTTASEVPSDLHDVFSHRLPDEVYFQLWRGLVGTTALDALTSGHWVDEPPLCSGATDDYKRFLKETLTEHPQGPRCVALGLLSSVLNPFWGKRQVVGVYYFENGAGSQSLIPHNSASTSSVVGRVNSWNVGLGIIEENLSRQNSSTIDLALCLGATQNSKLAGQTRTTKTAKLLEKKDEIVANTLWRFLELRGFLNSSHNHTAHAKALYLSLQEARGNDKFQEPLYLALELLRANVLHAGKFGGKILSGGPNIGSEADQKSMLLVLRVTSIVPINTPNQAWTGPLSRELLVFNSFLRALSRSIRALVEATTAHMLLRSDARRSREDCLEIALSLPFQNDSSTGMGIVVKGYCDAVWHMGMQVEGGMTGPQGKDIKEGAVELLEQPFGASVRNVKGELERGFRFWDTVCRAVKTLNKEQAISPELSKQFDDADIWLKQFR